MTIESALRDLNNGVLDLQAADYNTYDRPLRRIAAALAATELRPFVDALKAGVDFDAFLASAKASSGMAGSASLNWPTDREAELGLSIILIERAADNPHWLLNLAHQYYYSGAKIIGDIRKITSAVIVPFARDFAAYVTETTSKLPGSPRTSAVADSDRIFIVHGHDDAVRETVARFIQAIGLEPVILHEQANRGMTVPEKLAANANVGFAIVLLTPDDKGAASQETDLKPRARQNVILELGYFVGLLGRDRVCAMLKDEIEIPSDILGVVYTQFDRGGGWRQELAREIQSAGYAIDWNKVMR